VNDPQYASELQFRGEGEATMTNIREFEADDITVQFTHLSDIAVLTVTGPERISLVLRRETLERLQMRISNALSSATQRSPGR